MADELKPCPFCGGEAEIVDIGYEESIIGVGCSKCPVILAEYSDYKPFKNEVEAIEVWNKRAPLEYDGWFYLPKPKESLVKYGAPEITKTENGYKAKTPVEVIDIAIRSWCDELGDYVIKRMCEAWNMRHVETCKFEVIWQREYDDGEERLTFKCSNCGHERTTLMEPFPNYCEECGAKARRW